MACGEGMSYVGFSETSSIIVRVRGRGLAVSRRRRRAYGGCRSSHRFLASVKQLERKYHQHYHCYACCHNYHVASTQLETQTILKQHEPTPVDQAGNKIRVERQSGKIVAIDSPGCPGMERDGESEIETGALHRGPP